MSSQSSHLQVVSIFIITGGKCEGGVVLLGANESSQKINALIQFM